MQEYRLVSWPQLRPPFDRIGYRRMLSDMSHRHMSLAQLAECSGLRRQDVRAFVAMLDARQLLAKRDAPPPPDTPFSALGPLGGWLRRALNASAPTER